MPILAGLAPSWHGSRLSLKDERGTVDDQAGQVDASEVANVAIVSRANAGRDFVHRARQMVQRSTCESFFVVDYELYATDEDGENQQCGDQALHGRDGSPAMEIEPTLRLAELALARLTDGRNRNAWLLQAGRLAVDWAYKMRIMYIMLNIIDRKPRTAFAQVYSTVRSMTMSVVFCPTESLLQMVSP